MSIVAVERALVILKLMADTPEGIGVRSVARKLGYSPAVVQKSLQSLNAQGFATQDEETQLYRLGPEAVALGLLALGRLDVRSSSRPLLERLADETGETALLGVGRSDVAVYIDQVPSPHEVRMDVPVGAIRPYNCTAVGKVLLAHRDEDEIDRLADAGVFSAPTQHSIDDVDVLRKELDRVRHNGFAIDAEEFTEGARCVAAPIFDFEDRVVAAVGVAGPAHRLSDNEDEIIERVTRAAEEISRSLGASELRGGASVN